MGEIPLFQDNLTPQDLVAAPHRPLVSFAAELMVSREMTL
jgi:hypothetical protein